MKVKHIVGVLQLIITAIFFAPVFQMNTLISSMEISAYDYVRGITIWGIETIEPTPGFLFFIVLPLLVACLAFSDESDSAGGKTISYMILSIVDIIAWLGFWGITIESDDLNCINVTGWFIFMIILLMLSVGIGILVQLHIISNQTEITKLFMKETYTSRVQQVSKSIPSWNCRSCGTKMPYYAEYCICCGIAKSMQEDQQQAELYVKPLGRRKICSKCGAEVLQGTKFCIKCGEKVFEQSTEHLTQKVEKNYSNKVIWSCMLILLVVSILTALSVNTTPQHTVTKFFQEYNNNDFQGMVDCLDSNSRSIANGLSGLSALVGEDGSTDELMNDFFSLSGSVIGDIKVKIENTTIQGDEATVDFSISFETNDESQTEDGMMKLVKENGKWKIDWN